MTARSDAQQRHERVIMMVLEVDADTCTNTYGSAPCTAAAGAGNECYNTYATCQDKANFTRGVKTDKFCSRGQVVPGETVRPYIADNAAVTPTEIQPGKGLAMRSQTSIKLVDEPCPDHLEDPYAATRATPAQGTFWARYRARNPNLVGRPARVRRGYVVQPFTWDTFQTELFVIDAVRGPDTDGSVTLVLSDPLKIADRNMLPAATDGALVADLPAVADAGTAQAGGASTITLRTDASAVDDAYNGFEVYIDSGVGAGQRRVISDYVGATRVATVSVVWDVQPTSASSYVVSPLSLTLTAGKGSQYADPVADNSQGLNPQDMTAGLLLTGNTLSYGTSTGTARAKLSAGRGKYYWEVEVGLGTVGSIQIGVGSALANLNTVPISPDVNVCVYIYLGAIVAGGVTVQTIDPLDAGVVVGIALDADNGQITFYRDGVLQGVPQALPAGPWFPLLEIHADTSSGTAYFRRSQFRYAVPSGYDAWSDVFSVRIGDEVIEYTAKSGDVLSWPDGTYRGQWGTVREDHDAEDAVQLCRAWISKRPWEVLRDLHTESGISATYLDTTGWQAQDTDWLNGSEITAILTEPEKASALIAELLQDVNAIEWWDPVAQKARMLVNQPLQAGAITELTEAQLMEGSVKVERQDAERITQAAMYYGLRSATAERDQAKNYAAAAINIDVDAQSAVEYGDTRPSVSKSRWLGAANATFVRQTVARRVARLRDAPYKQTFRLDPRDEVALGNLVTLTHRALTDATGAPKAVRARVVRMADKGTHFEGTALTIGYGGLRYGLIAPNGLPNYGSASEAQRAYAFICNSSGLMGNGDDGYRII